MADKFPSIVFGDLDLEWSRPLRSELRRQGAHVSAATTTRDMLAMAAQHLPEVVVVDEHLEQMGRDLLLRMIRERSPGSQIVLILRDGGDDRRHPPGLLGSFSRPVPTEPLLELITSTLRLRPGKVASGEQALIMCVDDDPLFLKSLSRVLTREGYSVVTFDDPEKALEAIPIEKPDLIFLDVLMPGMSGLDLADEVREGRADSIPMVLITGRSSDLEISEGYRRGAAGYITKPCDPRAVLQFADYFVGRGNGPVEPQSWVSEEVPMIAESRPLPELPPLARTHVVVCVDDEPQILSSLKRLLRNEPYEVLTTEQPREALTWIGSRDVSLVISDQRMPEMLGVQLLEEVNRRSPATARIILTGYPGSTLKIQGLRQGLQHLVYKPWDDQVLKRTIRRILHDRETRDRDPGLPEGGAPSPGAA